jgi:hypothetical protein
MASKPTKPTILITLLVLVLHGPWKGSIEIIIHHYAVVPLAGVCRA